MNTDTTIDFYTFSKNAKDHFATVNIFPTVNINKKYKDFSNFSDKYPFLYKNKEYKTVEHAFQSLKFIQNEWYSEIIRTTKTPSSAKSLGCQKGSQWTPQDIRENIKKSKNEGIKIREDWDVVKEEIMYELIKEKFKQNKEIFDLLISTGNSIIREASPTDAIWGLGKDGKGKNILGNLLEKLRKEMKNQ